MAESVDIEVALLPEAGRPSIFDEHRLPTLDTIDQYRISESRAIDVARRLQRQGVTVTNIGQFTISGRTSDEHFEELFSTRLEHVRLESDAPIPDGYPPPRAPRRRVTIPSVDGLDQDVERVYLQHAPIPFGETPLPAPALVQGALRLRVPGDVAQIMGATPVHGTGVTGDGIRVAMVDSGFYHHPYFKAQGYDFLAVPAPDVTAAEDDPSGHGTGEAANLFATAPGINFVGVKMGNATLGFRTAVELRPAVITCSWGFDVDYPNTNMPNFLKPLYLEVLNAVRQGIIVCFSAGNGHRAFPANVPEVVAVGGVICDEELNLSATTYTSGFASSWFPGRVVPDVSGLCGEVPSADFIVLPVPETSGANLLGGWGAFSGTSAASPMVAGICALLRQVDPGIRPAEAKRLLQLTALDVTVGKNAMNEPAVPGPDLATGYGLANANRAVGALR
jgi:subtilisin family serine protease